MAKPQTGDKKIFWFTVLLGKEIYIQEGKVLFGTLKDILIDPNLLEIAALVSNQDKFLKRNIELTPTIEIKKLEKNSLFIDRANEIYNQEELPEHKKRFSYVSHLLGLEVMTTTGKRLGELMDVSFYQNGNLADYKLMQTRGYKATEEQGTPHSVPGIATHSLGSELLIINPSDY
jgi:sporulation protein YlmC with PRC-barrel domain